MKQVVAQLPKSTPTADSNEDRLYIWNNPSKLLDYVRARFGKHLQYFTPSLAKKLIGKNVVIEHGQEWSYGPTKHNLTTVKIIEVTESGVTVEGGMFPGDEEWIYWDDNDRAATGSGSDPVFIFVK